MFSALWPLLAAASILSVFCSGATVAITVVAVDMGMCQDIVCIHAALPKNAILMHRPSKKGL